MELRFRIPEIFLGALLATAIFAAGYGIGSAPPPAQHTENSQSQQESGTPQDNSGPYGMLLTSFIPDPALSVLTAILAGIALFQYLQTRALQRAYLGVEPLGVIPFTDDPDAFCFAHVGLKNAGRSPASNVRWEIKVAIDQDRWFKPAPVPVGLSDQQGGVIISNETMVQATRLKPGSIDGNVLFLFSRPKTDAMEPDLYIYVYGTVEYYDGYCRRTTRFCHRYFFRSFVAELTRDEHKGMSGLLPNYGVRYHEWGNEAD